MKRFINWLKNLQFSRIISVCIAATLLFLIQACNRPTIAGQPTQPAGQPPNARRYDPTQNYPDAKYERNIDNLSDVESRSKLADKAARERADELIEKAQKNIQQKGINSTDQYIRNYQEGTPLDQRIENLGKDVGSSATELKENVQKGTERGVENLQENVEGAVRDLTKNIKRGTEDVGKNIQRQAEDVGEAVNRKID